MTLPNTMRAVQLVGHGGLDKLVYRDDLPRPDPAPGEVLIKVAACGMNNTDINTRTAWYSKTVTESTAGGGEEGFTEIDDTASTWGGAGLTFPRIQGADVAGHIVAVGAGVSDERIGERVVVESWIRDPENPLDRAKVGYFGSECDGGYAEFTTVPAVNAFAIRSDLSDVQLATFSCSYSTAEYMLVKARLSAGETVLVTGASGGVGSALVQLSKRRGCFVIAVAGRDKCETIKAIGADVVIPRDHPNLVQAAKDAAPGNAINVAADIVGGSGFPDLLNLLARGGRYVTAGAIAGPIVELDLRTLYLRDLEVIGSTVMPPGIFKDLVGYIERGEIKPLVAKTFPLERLREAQTEFLEKKHVGNFVIVVAGS